jgi:hypothetical protein
MNKALIRLPIEARMGSLLEVRRGPREGMAGMTSRNMLQQFGYIFLDIPQQGRLGSARRQTANGAPANPGRRWRGACWSLGRHSPSANEKARMERAFSTVQRGRTGED